MLLTQVMPFARVMERGLSPTELQAMDRRTRQQLCRVLLVEQGLRIKDLVAAADHDDFLIERELLWRSRTGLVRVLYRSITSDDVERVAAIAVDRGHVEAVVIEAGAAARVAPAPAVGVQVVRAGQLITRLEASALVAWTGGHPHVDHALFQLINTQSNIFESTDVIGLRYLPWLSRNKKPPALARSALTADQLFEEYVFRLFTFAFRFGGHRLGSTRPATADPDALLFLPGSHTPALFDCKAARDGYRMSASDYRALREYAQGRGGGGRGAPQPAFVVIVSSSFAGVSGRRHPYFARARKLQGEAKARLVYLEADALIRFAIKLDDRRATPAQRDAIDWPTLFADGMPDSTAFDRVVP